MLDALAWLLVVVLCAVAGVTVATLWILNGIEPFDVVPDDED